MKIVKGNFSGSGSQKKNLQKQPNDIRANNGDAGYPDMILDLLKPYLGDKPDFEDVGDLMQLCIVAWNMANIKFFIPPDFKRTFDKTMMDMNIKGKDLTMVKEIMAEKQHKYPDYLNIIEDFDLESINEEMINVTVHSRAFSDIVEDEMENELEDDWDPEVLKNLEDLDDLNLDLAGNEIGFVNRSAITVKPTETYFEWLRKIDPDIDEETNIEDSIYLVTEMNSKKDFQKWIKKNFEKLFIAEIDVWLDESLWPKNMTYKMFTDFFTVTFCSTITDIEDSALRKY